MKIEISENADWRKLTDQGLRTVVDPLVFRCGELFLKGAEKSESPDAVWELLNLNLHAIGMFFDALILNEKLPVFNYGDTFDMNLDFDQRILTKINNYDEKDRVLYDVDVGWSAYRQVKTAALSELETAFNGEQKISSNTVKQISKELSDSQYKWSPNLENLEVKFGTDEEKSVAGYILSGLIFGGYAQLMEREHLMQPKRSRLFLAMSLQSQSVGHEVESKLFEDLKQRTNTVVEDLPWLPTFFPYLLSKAGNPDAMLREVVKLRHSPEVKDYRTWFSEVLQEIKDDGKISVEKRNDVKAIAKSVDHRIGAISSMPKVEMKLRIAAEIPLAIDGTPTAERLWGWLLNSLPGNRYRKLLTRAIVADYEYVKLENRIKKVWNAG